MVSQLRNNLKDTLLLEKIREYLNTIYLGLFTTKHQSMKATEKVFLRFLFQATFSTYS